MGYSSKEKFCSSGWGGRFRSDIRVMAAFHAGFVTALILILGVSLPLRYIMRSATYVNSSSPSNLKAVLNMRGDEFQQEGSAIEGNPSIVVSYREMAEARDVATEDIRVEVDYGEVPRRFVSLGTGNFLFSLFAAYRTGPKSFAVLGLGPRLMHRFWSKPGFECFWDSNGASSSKGRFELHGRKHKTRIEGTATNHYTQELEIPTIAEYTTVVVHCAFEFPVGADGKGGDLRMIANHGAYRKKRTPLGSQSVQFVALSEKAGVYDAALFNAPFKYEYLYCGGPLYGSVNPHRLREWLAYHMRLFGVASHFFFYDIGGINDDSWKVVEPWIKLGRLTIMNVRRGERYDTYYYGQFLYTNDCLFRAKSLAKWAFFFDIDEYLHVSDSPRREENFHKIMSKLAKRGRRATSVLLQQRLMSNVHCSRNRTSPEVQDRLWAIEKLVYRRAPDRSELFEVSGTWTHLDDFKSAVQPNYVLVMGVHEPAEIELPEGYTKQDARTRLDVHFEGCPYCFDDKLHYYHYHGTTSTNDELCKEFVDPLRCDATMNLGGAKHKLDGSMHELAITAREYELKTIGHVNL